MPFVPDAQPAAPTGRFVPDAPAQPTGPVAMPPASGLAGPVGTAIGAALSPVDAIASGLSHLASGVLTPPTALAARGIALLRGQDPDAAAAAVHNYMGTQGTYHAATPGGQALERDVGAAGGAVAAPFNAVANTVEGSLSPQNARRLESAAGTLNDVAGSIPLGGAAVDALRSATPAIQVARGASNVANEVGYTGLRTRADLKTPGSQSVTDSLIAQDAGVVPGSDINVAAVQNGRAVGPARVYNRVESSMPPTLTQDEPLQQALKSMGDATSQLPRSPDVDALRGTMLAQPDMTSQQLFANIRTARSRAAANLASDDPDKGALGQAYSQLADAYEDFAGRNIPPDAGVTLGQWQGARTQFAKSFLAEEALKGGEHFDPSVYGRAAQRAPDLLTGGGKAVADVYNALPGSEGEATTRGIGAAAGGLLGAGIEHAATGGFAGGGATGAIVGSQIAPAVRSMLSRYATRGDLDAAAAAPTNPRLSYFYDQGTPALAPVQAERPINGLGTALAGQADDLAAATGNTAAGGNKPVRRSARRVPDDNGE